MADEQWHIGPGGGYVPGGDTFYPAGTLVAVDDAGRARVLMTTEQRQAAAEMEWARAEQEAATPDAEGDLSPAAAAYLAEQRAAPVPAGPVDATPAVDHSRDAEVGVAAEGQEG